MPKRQLLAAVLVLLSLGAFAAYVALRPPSMTLEETRTAILSGAPLEEEAWDALRYYADRDDPVAQNNLAVALLRSDTILPEVSPMALLEAASVSGLPAARYNRVILSPKDRDLAADQIDLQINLLQQNIEVGDRPSMRLLSDRLTPNTWRERLPDGTDPRSELLAQAATDGTANAHLLRAQYNWRQARGSDDPAFVTTALTAYHAAFEAGDARGAEGIGHIMRLNRPEHRAAIQASGLSPDPLVWFARAGDMGLVTARCSYGLLVMEDFTEFQAVRANAALLTILMSNNPNVPRAIADLQACANPAPRPQTPNPPFGDPALYLSEVRPTWTSLANSPGWANQTLGILSLYGIGLPRDEDAARRYLTTAAEPHEFSSAADILQSLSAP